jgi:SAM-dependent methyltransferase
MKTKKKLEKYLGGFAPHDGTLEFYSRVLSIPNLESKVILNFGAGRGSWFFEDTSIMRRKIQDLRVISKEFIGVDVDQAVMTNPTTTFNLLMVNESIPLPSASVDVVIADWVLEHLENPATTFQEIDRILANGGFFCARTPHRFNFVSLVARFIPNKFHAKILEYAQPSRKSVDIFPTMYRANTKKNISFHFSKYEDYSYIYQSEFTYNFNNLFLKKFVGIFKLLIPKSCFGYLYVFLQKNNESE